MGRWINIILAVVTVIVILIFINIYKTKEGFSVSRLNRFLVNQSLSTELEKAAANIANQRQYSWVGSNVIGRTPGSNAGPAKSQESDLTDNIFKSINSFNEPPNSLSLLDANTSLLFGSSNANTSNVGTSNVSTSNVNSGLTTLAKPLANITNIFIGDDTTDTTDTTTVPVAGTKVSLPSCKSLEGASLQDESCPCVYEYFTTMMF